MSKSINCDGYDLSAKPANACDQLPKLGRVNFTKYEQTTMTVDCHKCANRGRVNGLSQESFCENCIHGHKWLKDYFKPLPDSVSPPK